jgi:hypothetical protein
MNVLLNRINAPAMFEIQNRQNQECIYLTDTVAAGSQKLAKVSISNLGHFFCQHITLSYTTLETVMAAQTDTGIDYLRGKLIDGSNMRPLFGDYIPFGLFAVPGRRKVITTSGSDSFQMQIVFPWEYIFTVNSDILMDVKNDSVGESNSYSMAFWGVRVKSSQTTSNL